MIPTVSLIRRSTCDQLSLLTEDSVLWWVFYCEARRAPSSGAPAVSPASFPPKHRLTAHLPSARRPPQRSAWSPAPPRSSAWTCPCLSLSVPVRPLSVPVRGPSVAQRDPSVANRDPSHALPSDWSRSWSPPKTRRLILRLKVVPRHPRDRRVGSMSDRWVWSTRRHRVIVSELVLLRGFCLCSCEFYSPPGRAPRCLHGPLVNSSTIINKVTLLHIQLYL